MVVIAANTGFGQSNRGPLEGVWQAVKVTRGGGQAMSVKPGPNLTVFAARHYSRIQDQAEKPRPVLADIANATADQLREVWGPLVAEAGTYEVNNDVVSLRPIVAKNPAAMATGIVIVFAYKLAGATLTLTAQRDSNGPVANPFTVELVRVE
jgi:hypothetical protein